MEATKTDEPTAAAPVQNLEREQVSTIEPTAAAPPAKTPAKRETKAKTEEPPPHPEDDALGFLAGTMGQGIDAELADSITTIQARLDHHVAHRKGGGPRDVTELKDLIIRSTESIRRRRQLEERRDRLRRIFSPSATTPAGLPLADEVKAIVLAVFGPEAAKLLRGIQSEIEASIRKRIDATAAELDAWRRYDRPYSVQGSDLRIDVIHVKSDAILEEVGKLLAVHREHSNRLGRITQDQSQAAQACRDACRKAIDDAGVEAVARAIREQRLIAERWWQADEEYPALANAEEALRTANAQANQLRIDITKDQEPGSFAAKSKATATDAAAQVAKLRAEIDARQKAAALELVKRAQTGDESARAEVSNSAARLRAAFPPGFAEAIHLAQYEGSQFQALIDELTAPKPV